MQLNADFSIKAVVQSHDEPWVASPLPGVERRMLDRVGGEFANRATTIVRYDPGSSFSAHTHGGGEEFIVLEGTFSDEHGDYKAGTYVRNPVGSHHSPSSEGGCTIFVKLGQMVEEDQEFVRIDTNSAAWLPGLVDGLEVMPLHQYGAENIALVRWQPGTQFQPHSHPLGEEILVLEGTFEDEHGAYPKGTWLRSPPGSSHTPFTTQGCTIYVKTGHLGAMPE